MPSEESRLAAVSLIDMDRASDEVRRVLDALPTPLRIFRLLGHADGCLRPTVSLGAAILGRQTLEPQYREIAVLRVASLTGAEYEWTQHEAIGRYVGLNDRHISAARTGDCAELDRRETLSLKVGEAIALRPGITSELLEQCVASFGEKKCVELVLAASYYLMLSRCIVSFKLTPEVPLGGALLDNIRTKATPSE